MVQLAYCFHSPPTAGARGERLSSFFFISHNPFFLEWIGLLDTGRVFQLYLEGQKYTCKHCGTHLALADDVRSTNFHSRRGRAYLFNKVVNVTTGEKQERLMISGMHAVAGLFCVNCGSIVGWKYEDAHGNPQRYKLGRHVLVRFKVLGPDGSSIPLVYFRHRLPGNDSDESDYDY